MKQARSIFLPILFSIVLGGCGKEAEREHFPRTPEELSVSIARTESIAAASRDIIRRATASDGKIDAKSVAEGLRKVEGVLKAEASADGATVNVLQRDSIWLNFLLEPLSTEDAGGVGGPSESPLPDDTELGGEEMEWALYARRDRVSYPDLATRGSGGGLTFPDRKTALILSPFRHQFKTCDSEQIRSLFLTAGFEKVDVFEDAAADWTKFEGEFLERYDVILIFTHGGSHCRNSTNTDFTTVTTGTEYTSENILQRWSNTVSVRWLGTKEMQDDWFISIIDEKENGNKCYLAASALNLGSAHFDDKFVFLCACSSAKQQSGNGSLVNAFKTRGAGLVAGWNKKMGGEGAYNVLSGQIYYRMSLGASFGKSIEILSDEYSQALAYFPSAAVSYYLFDPRPYDLTSQVDGGDVRLSWSMPPSGGGFRYDVFFDGKQVASNVRGTSWSATLTETGTVRWYVVAKSYTQSHSGEVSLLDSYASEPETFTIREVKPSYDGYWYLSEMRNTRKYFSGRTERRSVSWSADDAVFWLWVSGNTVRLYANMESSFDSRSEAEAAGWTYVTSRIYYRSMPFSPWVFCLSDWGETGEFPYDIDLTARSLTLTANEEAGFEISERFDSEGYVLDDNGNRRDFNGDGRIDSGDRVDFNGDGVWNSKDWDYIQQTDQMVYAYNRVDKARLDAWIQANPPIDWDKMDVFF